MGNRGGMMGKRKRLHRLAVQSGKERPFRADEREQAKRPGPSILIAKPKIIIPKGVR